MKLRLLLIVALVFNVTNAQQDGVQSLFPSAANFTGTISQTLVAQGAPSISNFSVSSTPCDRSNTRWCDWTTIVADISNATQADLLQVSFGTDDAGYVYPGPRQLINEPTFTFTGEAITDYCAGGIIEGSQTTVLGNIKESYWVAFFDGGLCQNPSYTSGTNMPSSLFRAVNIEFRINGNSLEVRQGNDRYHTSFQVGAYSYTAEYLEGDNIVDASDHNGQSTGVWSPIDLIEVRAESNLGTQTFSLGEANIVVGQPYLGIVQAPYQPTNPTNYIQSNTKDLGFPWGVNYFPSTFQEEGFTVSKGYFSDRVELNWRVYNNSDRITGFEIYRTEDMNSETPIWGEAIRNLSATANSFTDETTEGGKLYRYKLKALGVVNNDPDILYDTYIEGVGYRNPTGIITGNVSYEGGNPVKDVTIAAVPDGGFTNLGSALSIPNDGFLTIPRFHEELRDSITLQAWVKPAAVLESGDILELFHLDGASGNELEISLSTVSSSILRLSINDYQFDLSGYFPNGNIDNQGEDELSEVIEFHQQFNHISVRFQSGNTPDVFLNGRKIDQSYIEGLNDRIASDSDLSDQIILTETNTSSLNISIDPPGSESFKCLPSARF